MPRLERNGQRQKRRGREGGGKEGGSGMCHRPQPLSLPAHIHVSPHRVANEAAHALWRCQNAYLDARLELATVHFGTWVCYLKLQQQHIASANSIRGQTSRRKLLMLIKNKQDDPVA